MDEKQQYIALTSEIIAKQTVILGPDISILKARSVEGLSVGDDGKVIDINGDPKMVLQQLVNTYVELSGMIVKNALGSIFEKYPGIKNVD
ncbi:MAG: hypothetical protein V1688_03745 [bacterium]